MIISYAATIFLGAFLLFQVQLIIGKYILPWYGGTPSVWTTCMLFFQVLLLCGYASAHALVQLRHRRQIIGQLALLLLALLVIGHHIVMWASPLFPDLAWQPSGNTHPSGRILLLLTVSVGLATLVLATTSPLLQSWFAQRWPGRSPYRLYALSNLGSLLGLLSYPFLLEPIFSLKAQACFWTCGYVLFTAGFIACALNIWRHRQINQNAPLTAVSRPASDSPPSGPPSTGLRQRFFWFMLPACGSMILLATTNRMCQDVAAGPFLWVIPLSLYLLSFIISFDSPNWYQRRWYMLAFAQASILACMMLFTGGRLDIVIQIAAYAFIVFTGCMVCHGELTKLKPPDSQLTSFYLTLAAGGAAGGLTAGIIAPLLFTGLWEFHLALWLGWALVIGILLYDRDSCFYRGDSRLTAVFIPLATLFIGVISAPLLPSAIRAGWSTHSLKLWYYLLLLIFSGLAVALLSRCPKGSCLNLRHPVWIRVGIFTFLGIFELALLTEHYNYLDKTLLSTRNFYGVLRVEERDRDIPSRHHRILRHGKITHGIQFLDPATRLKPITYYGEESGVGLALRFHPNRRETTAGHRPLRVGVVGLGIGTIAAYTRTGDLLTAYEINPEIIRLSTCRDYFSYLSDTPASVEIVPGDARLSLAREVNEGRLREFDVLVLDAFSSDAIPAHLLTREAFEIYLKQLNTPSGILAIHITNRHLNLRPVMAQLARHFNLNAWSISTTSQGFCFFDAQWILMSRKHATPIPEIIKAAEPGFLDESPIRLWTDDYSNIMGAIR